jgi:hypothetical protein
MLTDGCDGCAIVDETGWGARFSQLVADGIVAEKLPAGMPPGQQRPAEGMAARRIVRALRLTGYSARQMIGIKAASSRCFTPRFAAAHHHADAVGPFVFRRRLAQCRHGVEG